MIPRDEDSIFSNVISSISFLTESCTLIIIKQNDWPLISSCHLILMNALIVILLFKWLLYLCKISFTFESITKAINVIASIHCVRS